VLVIGESLPVTTSASMYGIAADSSGNVFIADSQVSAIYRVDSRGKPWLFAGTPGTEGNINGAATVARFDGPRGIAVDRSGFVYVADTNNNAIRKIDHTGTVATVAPRNPTTGVPVTITAPFGVAVGPNGWIYVTANHAVYQIKPDGECLVLAGSPGNAGNEKGLHSGTGAKCFGTIARFSTPKGIAVDRSGNVYVADSGNDQIKKIYTDGWVVRHSGSTDGNVLGDADASKFKSLGFLTVNRTGDLFVIDNTASNTYRLKRVDTNGISTYISAVTSGDPARIALGVTADPSGVLFVVESDGTNAGSSSSTMQSVSSSLSSSSTKASVSSSSSSLLG